MRNLARRGSAVFAAGAVGGFANAVVLFLFGQWGVPRLLGVALAPGWSWPWLYQRLVWGGVWGALFLVLPRGFWWCSPWWRTRELSAWSWALPRRCSWRSTTPRGGFRLLGGSGPSGSEEGRVRREG